MCKMKADLPQPFLSSSLQSDKENVDEKKIGGAISFGKAIGALLQGLGRRPQLFLPEPTASGKKRFGASPCLLAPALARRSPDAANPRLEVSFTDVLYQPL
jgi:hypothetical protein